MKTVILVRHAKSSWDFPDLDDFERPLNGRGEKDAPRMGKKLKELFPVPETWVTSPAKRAFHTAQIFARTMGKDVHGITPMKQLYHAGDSSLLKIIQATPTSVSSLILFGHNPGLTSSANALMNESIDNIPTCGLVVCQIPVSSWDAVTWGMGEMLLFDFPKKKEF